MLPPLDLFLWVKLLTGVAEGGGRLICCIQKDTGKEEIENQRKGEPKDRSLMKGIRKANLDMPAVFFHLETNPGHGWAGAFTGSFL